MPRHVAPDRKAAHPRQWIADRHLRRQRLFALGDYAAMSIDPMAVSSGIRPNTTPAKAMVVPRLLYGARASAHSHFRRAPLSRRRHQVQLQLLLRLLVQRLVQLRARHLVPVRAPRRVRAPARHRVLLLHRARLLLQHLRLAQVRLRRLVQHQVRLLRRLQVRLQRLHLLRRRPR